VLCALIGRPDEDGVFVFEAGAGAGIDEFVARAKEPGAPTIAASEGLIQGRGPAGRAWRSCEVVRCDDYRRDPSTEPWREWAERWGWRASVAIPLCDGHGHPVALLSVYARWPGYFGFATRAALVDQIKRTVERAFAGLQDSPAVASQVRTYADREHQLRLLDDGRAEMFFQPVVDLRTGAVTKVEALARLRDGDRLIGPAEFLPSFGDEELLRLFELGLEQALEQIQRWERDGLVVGVSVNLPVASATDPRYARAVATALAAHPVPPGRLTLELLETGDIVGSLSQRRTAMDRFKEMGVRLAQDDLGSGYSSLLRLRHFAFDEVKIDKFLVLGNDFSPRTALHFIQPITDIAHSLGLSVVLEGLESRGLIEAAAQLGVDAGQGYGIARPMPGSGLVGWARGFRLDLDRERPRTHLGALAAHVAWEHRITAVGDVPARRALLDSAACALGAFVAARPDANPLLLAHEAVHRVALFARGSDEHRTQWERLVSLLGEG
jgi:EAL domain-containing protein (putative c-di-GMP-specific phosphodiesterase class I)